VSVPFWRALRKSLNSPLGGGLRGQGREGDELEGRKGVSMFFNTCCGRDYPLSARLPLTASWPSDKAQCYFLGVAAPTTKVTSFYLRASKKEKQWLNAVSGKVQSLG